MKRKTFEDGLQSNLKLNPAKRYEIIHQSVKSDPWKLKCMICMEELAELQQRISKQVREFDDKVGLMEEMADVYICLSFLEQIFNIKPDEMQKAIDVKLLREKRRLEDEFSV